MTTSTTSNHVHTTSMDAVKLTTSTTSTTSIDGRGEVDAVKRSPWTHHVHPSPRPPMSLPANRNPVRWAGMTLVIVVGLCLALTSSWLWIAARDGARRNEAQERQQDGGEG